MPRSLSLLVASAACVCSMHAAEPSVDRTNIFVEKVQRGELVRTARGQGTLAPMPGTSNLKAILQIPAAEAADIKAGLPALVDEKHGLMKGVVTAVSPESQGQRAVEITLDAVPSGVSAGDPVTGSVETDRAKDVLFMFTAAPVRAGSSVNVFKVEPGGEYVTRVRVETGRCAGNKAEVVSGLSEGDKIIITDMKQYEEFPRVKLR